MNDSILQVCQTDEFKTVLNILKEFGVKKGALLVLIAMLKDGQFASRDIEEITHLKQPEVSMAITDLMKKGWIEVAYVHTEKIGRPIQYYQLIKKPDEIFEELKTEIFENYKRKYDKIELLKTILRQKRGTEPLPNHKD